MWHDRKWNGKRIGIARLRPGARIWPTGRDRTSTDGKDVRMLWDKTMCWTDQTEAEAKQGAETRKPAREEREEI